MKNLVQAIKMNDKSIAMKRRMLSFLVPLILLLFLIFFLVLYFSGTLITVDEQIIQTLDTEANMAVSIVSNTYEELAARGINLSQNLTNVIEKCLAENGWSFSSLENNYEAIDTVEIAAYEKLLWAIEASNCSGAFMVLDTTVNTNLDSSEHSRSGLYLKMQNVSVGRPVNPDIAMFRGSAAVSHAVNVALCPQWELEFDLQDLPIFPTATENKNLVDSYYYTYSLYLPGTTNKAMFLVVPIIGNNGDVLGYCGFEISYTFFRINILPGNNNSDIVFTVLATHSEDTLCTVNGMTDNTVFTHYNDIVAGDLSVSRHNSFFRYESSDGEAYLGIEKEVYISPNNGDWVVVAMMPQDEYIKDLGNHTITIVLVLFLFLSIAIAATVWISNVYTKQIHSGLEMVKNRSNGLRSNIQEIDDLMEYLAQQDALRTATKNSFNDSEPVDEEKLVLFIDSVKGLSRAERAVYELYLEGLRAQEIADNLFISVNTVRAHSKQIYKKLGINSRKELLFYVRLMKEREHDSKAQ